MYLAILSVREGGREGLDLGTIWGMVVAETGGMMRGGTLGGAERCGAVVGLEFEGWRVLRICHILSGSRSKKKKFLSILNQSLAPEPPTGFFLLAVSEPKAVPRPVQ